MSGPKLKVIEKETESKYLSALLLKEPHTDSRGLAVQLIFSLMISTVTECSSKKQEHMSGHIRSMQIRTGQTKGRNIKKLQYINRYILC